MLGFQEDLASAGRRRASTVLGNICAATSFRRSPQASELEGLPKRVCKVVLLSCAGKRLLDHCLFDPSKKGVQSGVLGA